MRRLIAATLVAFLASPTAFAGIAPRSLARDRFGQAKTVALGYLTQDGFVSAVHGQTGALPADREVLAALRARIEDWGRYEVTDQPVQADLLIGIRIGHRGAISWSKPLATRDPASRVGGRSLAFEASMPYDQLAIYEADGGHAGWLLWEGMRTKGLTAPPLPLVEELIAVLDAAPRQP